MFDEIKETSGSGDEDIDAAAHGGDLGILADAAVDRGLAEADMGTIGDEALADLPRELAGGGQHESAALARLDLLGPLMNGVEDGQREAGGLAGAGLGAT